MKNRPILMLVSISVGMFLSARSATAQSMPMGSPISMARPASEQPPAVILEKNPKLGQKLQLLLPEDTTPEQASDGFDNIGHFVAAIHASHDLGIPVSQLRCTELDGKYCSPKTKVKSKNLENAILTLKPGMSKSDAKGAAKRAEKESKDDLKGVSTD